MRPQITLMSLHVPFSGPSDLCSLVLRRLTCSFLTLALCLNAVEVNAWFTRRRLERCLIALTWDKSSLQLPQCGMTNDNFDPVILIKSVTLGESIVANGTTTVRAPVLRRPTYVLWHFSEKALIEQIKYLMPGKKCYTRTFYVYVKYSHSGIRCFVGFHALISTCESRCEVIFGLVNFKVQTVLPVSH